MKYELQHCIGSRLRRLSRVVDNYYRQCLTDFDITENQMTMLFAMNVMGKAKQGYLGEALALERSTVSRNVRLLESKQLVLRSINYNPEIELTKKGKELVDQLIPLWERVMDDLNEKLGEEGMVCINHVEQKLL